MAMRYRIQDAVFMQSLPISIGTILVCVLPGYTESVVGNGKAMIHSHTQVSLG